MDPKSAKLMSLPRSFPVLQTRLEIYARLVRLDRPVGIWLLLWPTLWSLWLVSGGLPATRLLLIFIAGVVLMRSAGCAINDYADRKLDRQVARTRNRPLAQGEIPPREALWVAAVLLGCALGLALMLPPLTLALAVPAVLLVATYPFAKRWHHLPQLHLGLAFAWAVPMAISAYTGDWLEPWGWLAFIATVLWVVAYDTLYAMADREEDLAAGNRSTAILFGSADLFMVGLLQGLFLLTLLLLGIRLSLPLAYYGGLAAALVLVASQMWRVRSRHPEACFRAFGNNVWVGAAIWVGIVLATAGP